MSVGKEWEIPLRQTQKFCPREFFLAMVALNTPIEENHYLRDIGPFPRYCHMCALKIQAKLGERSEPHTGVFNRDYICRSVGRYVCRGPKCVGGITWPKHVRAQSQFWVVKTDL